MAFDALSCAPPPAVIAQPGLTGDGKAREATDSHGEAGCEGCCGGGIAVVIVGCVGEAGEQGESEYGSVDVDTDAEADVDKGEEDEEGVDGSGDTSSSGKHRSSGGSVRGKASRKSSVVDGSAFATIAVSTLTGISEGTSCSLSCQSFKFAAHRKANSLSSKRSEGKMVSMIERIQALEGRQVPICMQNHSPGIPLATSSSSGRVK